MSARSKIWRTVVVVGAMLGTAQADTAPKAPPAKDSPIDQKSPVKPGDMPVDKAPTKKVPPSKDPVKQTPAPAPPSKHKPVDKKAPPAGDKQPPAGAKKAEAEPRPRGIDDRPVSPA